MRRRATVDVGLLAGAATIAAVVAVWFFIVLMMLAKAHAVEVGEPRASKSLARIEAALRTPGDPYAYPEKALCHEGSSLAIARIRQQLATAASAGEINLANTTLEVGAPEQANGWLSPVALHVEATGRYDAMIGFLTALAKTEPEIFLTSAELRSKASAVALTLNGSFYCSTSARR